MQGLDTAAKWEVTAAVPDPAQEAEVDASASSLLHLPQRTRPKVNLGRSILTSSQHSSESPCIYIYVYIYIYSNALLFLGR